MKHLILTTVVGLVSLSPLHAQIIPVYLDESKPVEQRIDDALSRMTLDEKIAVIHAQSKFSSPGVKRLGFPDLWTDDGPHGVRPDVLWDEWVQAGQTNDSCVAFPALTCLAATWNPDMARLYGESLGEEALYRKKSVILGPGVNIYRTPLGGRNFEYMGEDPYLASRMVVPYVQGLQSKGVASCVKHYCLNNDEEYRHQVNVKVSDRALHEIYLPAFKAAVTEGKAWAIMGAYNLYQNQHNCHNNILLNQILKRDWAFDGVVVSDWGGCHDTDEAVKNGLDLEFGTWTDGLTMGKTNAYDSYHMAEAYKKAILQGKYTTKELDEKVRRVLRLFYRTTMQREKPFGFLCSESHYEAALKIAQEGIVLLKNEGAIPLLPIDLAKTKRILVVGENAIKMMTVGGGSSSLKVQKEILPLDALQTRVAGLDYARGYVGDTIQSFDGVSVGRSLYETRPQAKLTAEAVEKAREADVVIFFGGLNKAAYQDSEGHDRQSYDLPYAQNEVIEAILKVNPRLVYVNISGNGAAMPWLAKVPAVVQAWFIGSEAGEAIASVLFGDVNPSGKLPYSYPKYSNAMNTYDHKVSERVGTMQGAYDYNAVVDLQWAFGYGLSYTSFEYSNLTVAECKEFKAGDTIKISVDVTNTGDRAGKESVLLFINDDVASIVPDSRRLRDFEKIELQPGETKTVCFEVAAEELAFAKNDAKWYLEKGSYTVQCGQLVEKLTCLEDTSLGEHI
jgi:beta-glucosidase